MPTRPLTDEQVREAHAALEAYGTRVEAARQLGLSEKAFRNRLKGGCGKDPIRVIDAPPETHKLGAVGTHMDADGNVTGQTQWYKPEERQREEALKRFAEGLCKDIQRVKPSKKVKGKHENLFSIIPLADAHFGMYAWAAECGRDFDLKIAEHDYFAAVDWLVDQSPSCEKSLLMNLGDLFHAENMDGVTQKSGNVLDVDTRFPEMIDVGVRTMRRCLERMLEKHKTVDVINVPGNHDETVAHIMSIMLRNIYEREPRVNIRYQPADRQYMEFGRCLIGSVHGHKTKDRDLMAIMATEQPEAWGRTKHRYFYRGHDHTDSKVEYNGGYVEHFRTLTPGDAFAIGNGYLSGQDLKCILMHEEHGERVRFTGGIDMFR